MRPPVVPNYPFPIPGLRIDGFGQARTTAVGIRTFVPGGRGIQIDAGGARSHGLLALPTRRLRRGWAGFFNGSVFISSLQKMGGGFTIDYPGDEENRYLRHSFVESPDMLQRVQGHRDH